MKSLLKASVVLLLQGSKAVSLSGKIKIEPDVFGPEGLGYTNNNTNIEVDQIGIDFIKTNSDWPSGSSNKKCQTGHLATISYTGSLEDGQVVTDLLQEFGRNQTINIGTAMTYGCIDLALQQVHSGD